MPEAAPILAAWTELSTARPFTGFGLSPIPFQAIDRYAERYGLTELDDFDAFRRAIRALDAFFIGFKPQGGD